MFSPAGGGDRHPRGAPHIKGRSPGGRRVPLAVPQPSVANDGYSSESEDGENNGIDEHLAGATAGAHAWPGDANGGDGHAEAASNSNSRQLPKMVAKHSKLEMTLPPNRPCLYVRPTVVEASSAAVRAAAPEPASTKPSPARLVPEGLRNAPVPKPVLQQPKPLQPAGGAQAAASRARPMPVPKPLAQQPTPPPKPAIKVIFRKRVESSDEAAAFVTPVDLGPVQVSANHSPCGQEGADNQAGGGVAPNLAANEAVASNSHRGKLSSPTDGCMVTGEVALYQTKEGAHGQLLEQLGAARDVRHARRRRGALRAARKCDCPCVCVAVCVLAR